MHQESVTLGWTYPLNRIEPKDELIHIKSIRLSAKPHPFIAIARRYDETTP